MKLALCLLFVAATVGLRADEVTAEGKITAVTVFGDRAEVTRSARVSLDAGVQQVRFEGAPDALFRDSLQLKASGPIVLQDIRLDTVYLDEVADETSRQLQTELTQLKQDKRAAELAGLRMDQEAKALQTMWAGLASRSEGAEPVMDPDKWSEMLDFQSRRLTVIDETRVNLETKITGLEQQIQEQQEKIRQHRASDKRTRTDIIVVVESAQKGEFPLALIYQTGGARWAPSYQVRADSKGNTVQVRYRAQVAQNTGEDWEDVALSLSTAQPHLEGQAPELEPWWVSIFDHRTIGNPARPVASVSMEYAGIAREREGDDSAGGINHLNGDDLFLNRDDYSKYAAKDLAEALVRLPGVSQGVTATTFSVPSKMSVPASSDPVICTLLQFQSRANFRHTAVPKLSSHVYLKGEITNETDGQLLPGPASIFIDGNYIGKAALELVSPGEQFWVNLGVDPAVQVERKQLEGEDGDAGMFSGDKRVVRKFEFVINNRRQQAIELSLHDQIPMTNNDDIEIELLTPEISSSTTKITMNDEKEIEWKLNLRPGEERKVPFSYAVEYPKDKRVSGL